MALSTPTRTGGDYLDLRAETAREPLLVIFRIREFLPGEPDNYRNTTYPVLADALVCSGPETGKVYPGGTYKYAITNALRGAGRDDPNPTTKVGEDLAIRCEQPSKKGTPSGTVFGNVPSAAELEKMGEVYEAAGGEGPWRSVDADGDAGSGPALAATGTDGPAPVRAARPWER